MTRLVLAGAGGHGKVAADVAAAAGYQDIAFVDQNWPKRKSNGAWKIIGDGSTITQGDQLFCAIGNNASRQNFCETNDVKNFPVLIHPQTVISPTVTIGAGTLVVAGVIINADTRVGFGAILNTGCSVDHDCNLGDFCHISPGARLAGGVTVGERSWIGIGAVVKEGVVIGPDVIVGAGAAVVNDIAAGDRVGGVPARKICTKDMKE